MPTSQETYDQCVNFMRDQGVQGICDGAFGYRLPNGLTCPAGYLIPDDRYDSEMEKAAISSQFELDWTEPYWRASRVLYELGYDLVVVRAIQVIHDMREPWEWEEHFEAAAEGLNLIYTER